MKIKDLFIEWKYNDKVIFKSKETDYHCSINNVETKLRSKEIVLSLRPKRPEVAPTEIKFKPAKGIKHVEIWTANGKYHQHNIKLYD